MTNPPDHKIHFVEHSTDMFAACGASNPRNVSLNTKHTTCARCRRTEIFSICESGDRETEQNWGGTTATLPKTGKGAKGKTMRSTGGKNGWAGKNDYNYKPCYHTHPPYPVAEGITILGGSGVDPIHADCDIYISLEGSRRPGPKSLPWNPGHDIVFPVRDFKVPDDAAEFRKLVDWTAEQLKSGAKVHAGCMMGHGRTGMLFVGLRAVLHGPEQAIQHVRANYCKKAVDTAEQVAWLVKHFGVDTAPERERGPYLFDKPAKTTVTSAGSSSNFSVTSQPGTYHGDRWPDNDYDDISGGYSLRRNTDQDFFRHEGESVNDWLKRTERTPRDY